MVNRIAAVVRLLVITSLVVIVGGCNATDSIDLTIVSGSENKSLEPIIHDYAKRNDLSIRVDYMGSVDMMLKMSEEDFAYDAVWPANSLWITLGDRDRRVKHIRSIMTSPVVFGIRRSTAERLGFTDGSVTVSDILDAILNDDFRFMMTSATQSNSGASAYLGFLYALAQQPDVLTLDHLAQQEVKDGIRSLLAGVHRSSGSSGWLMELFVETNIASDDWAYDAMVNYEALMIEANTALVAAGKEPLYVVYPEDGIVTADSPLGYVDRGDDETEDVFLGLQEYLLSDATQRRLAEFGRRTGIGGVFSDSSTDSSVFNPAWGIDAEQIISPFRTPSAEVITQALQLYQTEFRKPSLTYYALDFSGSMIGEGERSLKAAVELLLDQGEAARYMLQAGSEDRMIVVPFSSDVWENDVRGIDGNDPEDLASLLNFVTDLDPGGGTDIYAPAIYALGRMAKIANLDDYIPAIILMTDGESTTGNTYEDLQAAYRRYGIDVPIFAIRFGAAKEAQLAQIAELTRARTFDGREDLVEAFRSVKGYN